MAVVQGLCLVVLENGEITCTVFSRESTLHFEMFKKHKKPHPLWCFSDVYKSNNLGT